MGVRRWPSVLIHAVIWCTVAHRCSCYQMTPVPIPVTGRKKRKGSIWHNLFDAFFPGQRTLCVILCWKPEAVNLIIGSACECPRGFWILRLNHMWIKHSAVFLISYPLVGCWLLISFVLHHTVLWPLFISVLCHVYFWSFTVCAENCRSIVVPPLSLSQAS